MGSLMSRFADIGSGRRDSAAIKELENHYASFNTSGDGLTLEQTQRALAALDVRIGVDQLLERIRRVNDDSSLCGGHDDYSLVDFHLFTHLLSQNMDPLDHNRMLREAFSVFDHGDSGVISSHELSSVMRTMGHGPRTQHEIDEMFRQMEVCPQRGISFAQMQRLLVLDRSRADARAQSRAHAQTRSGAKRSSTSPGPKRSPSAGGGSTASSVGHASSTVSSTADLLRSASVASSSVGSSAVSLQTLVGASSAADDDDDEATGSEGSARTRSASGRVREGSGASVRTDTTEL